MIKAWKQVKIFTADSEQSVMLEPTPEREGIVMHTTEEEKNGKTFATYLSTQEAIDLAEMINNYVETELNDY